MLCALPVPISVPGTSMSVVQGLFTCAWWENVLSLNPGETWKHRALLDYYTLQPMTEIEIFHLQRSEIAPATVRFCNRLPL